MVPLHATPEYCNLENILEQDQLMIRRPLEPDIPPAINPISWSTWQFWTPTRDDQANCRLFCQAHACAGITAGKGS